MEKYLKTNRSTLSKTKRWMIGLLPRKFHCFGLGAGKTGTTTIASMLQRNFRSGHEVDPEETTRLMVDYDKGILAPIQVKAILKKRDKLLNLEMESAGNLVYVSDLLPEIFPDAKFIVTIREPYSLLESRLNWAKTPSHPAWTYYIQHFFKSYHTGYEKEEEILKRNNIYSLDSYLKQYAGHYRLIFENIPQERLIFIKTHNLKNAPEKISSFLNIDVNSLQIAHSKKNTDKVQFLDQMDQTFVRSKIWEHCNTIIKNFYPETIHLYK